MNKLLKTTAIALVTGAIFLGCQDDSKGDTNIEINSELKETIVTREKADIKRVSVVTEPIIKRSFEEYYSYYGVIEAENQTTLISYNGGEVHQLNVKEGQYIKKNTPLCDIDADIYTTQYEAAQTAQSLAEDNYKRLQKHLQSGNTSSTRVKQAKLEYLTAKQQALQTRKIALGAECRSSISGRVLAKHISRFDNIAPGTATLTIGQTGVLKVKVGIPEDQISGFKAGNVAEIRLSSEKDKVWYGKIYSIAQALDPQERKYMAEVRLTSNGNDIQLGLVAKVKLLRKVWNDAVVIPSHTIISLATENVVMVNNNGVAQKRSIEVVASNETEVLVTGAIAPGDDLIVKGYVNVVNGSPLKIVEKPVSPKGEEG
ncbi:MAG: efflux RND transporter periplasmic adaptor subunit [Fibrobacterales bacterium]